MGFWFVRAWLALALCVWLGVASAHPYPNKPITIIVPFVPFVPATASDLLARIWATEQSQFMG